MKVVHYPLASPNVTSSLLRNSFLVASAGSVNVDVGASATPSFFVLRNLTLPTKWLANATPSWTYDAAGNRASDSTNAGSWSYDNLNRMTASPGATYTNDILGNRLTKGTTSNTWDDLNRMTANVTSGTTSNFIYRADGLRMQKENHTGSTNSNLTRYRYDGQIGVEDVDLTSTNGGVSYSVSAVNRFALGGRGIDAVSRTTSSGTVVTYPLYDVHGNGVGSLSKSGSSWCIADERTYDAWGVVRSGGTSENKGRYVANLGHKQDDESSLIYMRARYYEPTSGRFVNQDTVREGANWFVYCRNDGVNYVDESGNSIKLAGCGLLASLSILALLLAWAIASLPVPGKLTNAAVISCLTLAVVASSIGFCLTDEGQKASKGLMQEIMGALVVFADIIALVAEGMNKGTKTAASLVVFANATYSIVLISYMAASIAEGETAFNEPWK